MNIEIDNYFELLALHKSLMAVKFDPTAYLPEAQGSPYTASLAFKVFDLLVSSSNNEGKPEQAKSWLTWQTADIDRPETKLLLQRIAEEEWWSDATEELREKFVIEFMAPLKLDADVQLNIIKSS